VLAEVAEIVYHCIANIMDSLEYIDAFFQGRFSPEETGVFEQRIKEDPAFAADVAYYIGARGVLRETREEERVARFAVLYRQADAPRKVVRMEVRRWLPVVAAAALLAVAALCWLLFRTSASPQQVADRWMGKNLSHLSVNLGGAGSLQRGLDLYNSGRYPEALRLFEDLLRPDTLNPSVLLDAGIVSLRMGNYDQSLDFFRKLASLTDPNLNPALFFEALTLLKRNRDGDADLAKQLLRRIVRQDLDKGKDAKELLREL
jgi:tetratricopeptide (TPR) repeat protein